MTPTESTRTHIRGLDAPPTGTHDPAFEAGLAAAFGPDPTPGGWSQPPLLRDDPSDHTPLVQPSSTEMPRGSGDRYQLLGEIARGGMGVIFKGRDPDLGRDLAFKVLKAELAARPAAVQRFVEEAQVGGQLQHPGVVPVYDLGRFADGRPYFAMKLVKGRTLAEMLTDRANPSADRGKFLPIFLQVCQAIGYAHSRGVIHRDLKPSNVMVGGYGEVLVMDWGLAKVLPRGGVADDERVSQTSRERKRPEEEPTVIHTARSGSGAGSDTQAGSVMGTPAYMPPEQAGGEIDKLDERADVFGLGAVLCVILTGEPPYVADSGEAVRLMAVRGQLEAAFARLDACAADADLVVLCKRCLAADRDARPRHAGVVTVELAAHLAGIEERVHRAELERAAAEARAVEEANTRRVAEEKTTEERKRRRVQLALAASLLLLIGLVGLGAWWRERAEGDRKAEQARVEAERTAIESRLRLNVESAVGLAADLRKKYRFAEARTALDQAAGLIPADGPDDLREQLRQAVGNLAFVRELDEIRMKCSIWVQEEGGQGHYDFASAPPAYRAAFLAWGIDVASGDAGVVAGRIRESSVKADLVAALDDWAVLERDATVRNRVLVVARLADPGVWLDRFRDPTVRADAAKVMVLAEEADPAALSPGTVTALAELMRAHRLDPTRLLLAAQFTHPADFLISYTAGQWFYMKKDMKEAVAHFRAARVTRPDNLAILINMGSALRDQGDLKGAASSFREAVRLDPTFGKAHHNLGNILRKEKNWDGAVASFREAIRLDPKDAALRSTLGNTMKEKGDLDGAIALYKEAIAVDPKNATIHYNLGYALSFKPDMDGAASCFAEAIRLNPDYAEAHNNLGLTRKLQGDFDGAAASFRTAIRLKPRLANAHTNLGNVLKDKGDITGALASYQEAIRADPSDAIAHNNLGIVFLERKDLVGAIELSRTSIRLDPNYGPAHNSLGIALTRMGDLDGAIAAFTEAIRLEPKNPEYHINLGIALGIKGDIKGAPVPLREAVRLDPKNARAHSLLGGILRQAKDLDGAIASYQESIRLRPTNIDAHRNLGMTLALHGRPGEALRVTTDALRANRAWADDPRNFLRYNAACFAMNCADGKGTDAPPPGERPAYRRRALDYLTADLAATRKLAAAEPSLVHRRLKDWLADPDLVSIRERAELEKLPIDERVGWVKLWTEVRELRDETAPAELAPPPRPVKR